MFNVAIIEDDASDYAFLKTLLDQYAQENGIGFNVTYFRNADSFLFEYQPVYDLIFMDIMMPGTNGMDSAKKLRSIDKDTLLIFITTISRLAIEGYSVNAFDYILKPLDYPSFSLKLKRALDFLPEKEEGLYEIRSENGKTLIRQADIIYVEVMNHNLTIHTKDGDFRTYGSLKSAAAQLSDRCFERCSSSFLINLNYVSRIDGNQLYLGQGGPVSISRSQKQRFVERFHRYLKGG